MKLIKHWIFKIIIFIFVHFPFNRYLAILLRKIGFGQHPIYKDLKFKGLFSVNFNNNNLDYKFSMQNYGGRIENETFWKGLFKSFEIESGDLWIEFSRSTKVIFDIGANTGIYSLVSKTVNTLSEVHAFEPSINTYNKLTENISINNIDIKHYPIALGEYDGEQIFYDYKIDNQTSASLSPEKSKGIKEVWEYKVSTLRLDSFIEKYNITKIDLIKLDVEMFEPEVLMGFSGCIDTFLPVIFIEVLTDEVANKIFLLIEENYYIYQLNTNNTIKKVDQFIIVAFVWNYLLIPKSKISMYQSIISKFEV